MPTPSRKRVLDVPLAGCGAAGCSEAVMLAQFNGAQLTELVDLGFAAVTTEHVVGNGQNFEVTRFKITEAGLRTLGGQQ